MSALRQTTTLSDDGRVELSDALRERQGWTAGNRLVLEHRFDGVLITRESSEPRKPVFPPTRIEDVAGMLKHNGPPISLEEMDEAIGRAASERYWKAVSREDDGSDRR